MIPSAFHRALRAWFRKNGRHLPWRDRCDPYAVLVSEFMLQQTTVAAVIPYFRRWMKRFPNIRSLAAAEEQEVLQHWQGLGYYSRGRNLHRVARAVLESHSGVIPSDPDLLRSLPGIGPYTAAAVAAFAFDLCIPVLDANILRVIARLENFTDPVTTASGKKALEEAARRLLPASGGRGYTSAIMDLGAMVCRSGNPDCPKCPVRTFCKAENPAAIPVKPAKKPWIHETDVRGLARSGESVFLVQSDGPRWRGLWLLPPAESGGRVLHESQYVVTRHRIQMQVVRVKPAKSWSAFDVRNLPPMPSPHLRALEKLLQ